MNPENTLPFSLALSRTHSGWKEDEEQLLWHEVRRAHDEGRALKSVFDEVASQTGRKPNSIRNYYYARAKENPDTCLRAVAFVPFTEQEIWDLLLTVLGEQARGVSVRACTLAMGGGDTRAMLRYQNKYRALIKTNPALVRSAVNYMHEHGMPCVDPYEAAASKVGRPRKEPPTNDALIQKFMNLLHLTSEMADAKSRIRELESIVLSGKYNAQ